jgi:hypothetical protein
VLNTDGGLSPQAVLDGALACAGPRPTSTCARLSSCSRCGAYLQGARSRSPNSLSRAHTAAYAPSDTAGAEAGVKAHLEARRGNPARGLRHVQPAAPPRPSRGPSTRSGSSSTRGKGLPGHRQPADIGVTRTREYEHAWDEPRLDQASW